MRMQHVVMWHVNISWDQQYYCVYMDENGDKHWLPFSIGWAIGFEIKLILKFGKLKKLIGLEVHWDGANQLFI